MLVFQNILRAYQMDRPHDIQLIVKHHEKYYTHKGKTSFSLMEICIWNCHNFYFISFGLVSIKFQWKIFMINFVQHHCFCNKKKSDFKRNMLLELQEVLFKAYITKITTYITRKCFRNCLQISLLILGQFKWKGIYAN